MALPGVLKGMNNPLDKEHRKFSLDMQAFKRVLNVARSGGEEQKFYSRSRFA